jgi:hypothetical protein
MARVSRRCALSIVFLFLPLVFTAGPADAGEITGGCTGTVNNQDATLLTSDDPAVVRAGEQLTVAGNIPAQFAVPPANPFSDTTVKISIIDGVFGIKSGAHETSGPAYSASVDVDDYFDAGVGLYRIDVVNSGTDWRCEYTGYVELDGDPLSKPVGLVALAAIIIGAVGVMVTKGRKPREPGWIDSELDTANQIAREEAWQSTGLALPEAVAFQERGSHAWLPQPPLHANEQLMWSGKVRLHGHPIAAFFWGLLLGLGIGVLGWQDGRWTLKLGTIVVLPLVIAAVAALFAWFGWGYRIRDVAILPGGAAPVRQPDDAAPVREPLATPTSADALDTDEPTRSDG